MRIIEVFLAELEQEAAATRRVLERVPTDRLDWKPHARSMSLGQLGYHIAGTPGGVAGIMAESELELPEFAEFPTVRSADELVPLLDRSIEKAKQILGGLDDEAMRAGIRMTQAGQVVTEMTRVALARSVLLNHWYHHRGQLTVYLRLLDVPVPSIYGPSADENPFA